MNMIYTILIVGAFLFLVRILRPFASVIGLCAFLWLIISLYYKGNTPEKIALKKQNNNSMLVVNCRLETFQYKTNVNGNWVVYKRIDIKNRKLTKSELEEMSNFKFVVLIRSSYNSYAVDTFKNGKIEFVDNEYYRNFNQSTCIQRWRKMQYENIVNSE